MQIIKGIAIAAVLIIAGLLALIVAAYLAFRIAAAGLREESEAVENDEYITGHNSAGIAGDIFKTGQTGREGQRE